MTLYEECIKTVGQASKPPFEKGGVGKGGYYSDELKSQNNQTTFILAFLGTH